MKSPPSAISASGRAVPSKRAAAARANGSKSRGPITAQGKANSSRNSCRHGLRSRTLFADPASAARLSAELAAFESDLRPQSESERMLVHAIAHSFWQLACLWKREQTVLKREMDRLQNQTPHEEPVDSNELLRRAFASLVDRGCALDIIHRLESRAGRQLHRALAGFNELRAARASVASSGNIDERTQQVAENTDPAPHPQLYSAGASSVFIRFHPRRQLLTFPCHPP